MIPVPELDDLSFDVLVAEARGLLPSLDPTWTDHNPSDPGIALIELFAWLTELLSYRLDQVPDAHLRAFLALLADPDAPPLAEDLQAAMRASVRNLREPFRAVTSADYERLVREIWPASPAALALGAAGKVARVRAVADRALPGSAAAPGHISLLILPGGDLYQPPDPALLSGLASFLEERRLLTTRLHLQGPSLVGVEIHATLFLRDDGDWGPVRTRALAALEAHLDLETGGPDGAGWPLGRGLSPGEVYTVLECVRGVDFVEDVRVVAPPERATEAGGLRLEDHELPQRPVVHVTLMRPWGELWKPID